MVGGAPWSWGPLWGGLVGLPPWGRGFNFGRKGGPGDPRGPGGPPHQLGSVPSLGLNQVPLGLTPSRGGGGPGCRPIRGCRAGIRRRSNRGRGCRGGGGFRTGRRRKPAGRRAFPAPCAAPRLCLHVGPCPGRAASRGASGGGGAR